MHVKHVPQDYGRSTLPKNHVAEQILQVEVAVQLLSILMVYHTTKVCGKIIGYQFGFPSGFYTPYISGNSIESAYLDGVSLTHGGNPRKHIWSFANALEETPNHENGKHVCPCSNPQSTMQQFIPTFVGRDYFCDSSDPLWDGAGCESPSTCCSFNNPPWFYKQLNNTANDDVEMRICADQDANHDEDSPVELVEIYVQ